MSLVKTTGNRFSNDTLNSSLRIQISGITLQDFHKTCKKVCSLLVQFQRLSAEPTKKKGLQKIVRRQSNLILVHQTVNILIPQTTTYNNIQTVQRNYFIQIFVINFFIFKHLCCQLFYALMLVIFYCFFLIGIPSDSNLQ